MSLIGHLFFEDKFHEGGVEVVSNFSVLFLFGNEFVCKLVESKKKENVEYT